MPELEHNGASEPRPTRLRGLAPVAAAGALVAVIVAVAVARPGSRDEVAPALSIVQVAGGGLGVAESTPAMGAPSGRSSGWGEWKLDGDLPDGPSSAAVQRLRGGPVSRALVERLATSLGLHAAPQHLDGGWYVLDGTRELSVSERAGGHWVYADHGCVAGPVLDPQQGVGCAIAQPGVVVTAPPAPSDPAGPRGDRTAPVPTPGPSPEPVSADDAARAARPVLDAVGLDPRTAVVRLSGDHRDVVVRPRVSALTVLGLDTSVSVGPDATVKDAAGWLGDATPGAEYPVITARSAFELLRNQPRPMIAEMPCQVAPGAGDCPAAPDRIVTGAELGLALGYQSNGTALLLPAWLLAVRGQDDPAVVVAVESKFLGSPGGTGGSTGSTGSGGSTGSTGGVAPPTAAPVPPAPRS